MNKEINRIYNEITDILKSKINCKTIKFKIEHPEKETEFYEPTVLITRKTEDDTKTETHRSRIYLKAQQNIIYYFPTDTHKKIVTKVAEILTLMAKKPVTIKESPCKTCPKYLQCRMAFPCAIHIEQIGSYTKTSCIIYENSTSLDKELLKNLFTPLI